MILLATRKGETVEVTYSSWRQLYNIVRHCRKWNVILERKPNEQDTNTKQGSNS